MRTIDSAIMDRLAAKELRPFVLLDLDIDSVHYRYTDCDVPIVVGGDRYEPRGFKLEPVRYSLGTVVDSAKMQVDNLDNILTPVFVGGTPQGSDVTIKLVLMEQWGEVDDETGASWGPTVHGLSLAAGQGFIKTQGVSLAPFAGTEGASTPHLLTIHDSASKTAKGYIGAADAAETLGGELLANIGFETAGGGGADIFGTWLENTSAGGTLADEGTLVHGGSHALKATCGAVNNQYAHEQQNFTTVTGKLYKITFWTRGDGTRDGNWLLYDVTNSSNYTSFTLTNITGTTFTQVAIYFTARSISTRFYLCSPMYANGSAYFDDVSIQEVTHVGATGVHIVSEKDGSVRDWSDIQTGFNYNGAAYTFEVRSTTSETNRVYYQLNDPVTLFQGTIDGWDLDEEKVSLTVASELVQWSQRTLAKHSSSCRWKKFKGTECTYAGAEVWCDRTYIRCAALSNQANFGGFRWLPSIIDKEIWWGPSANTKGSSFAENWPYKGIF